MSWYLALPLVTPFVTAVLAFLFRTSSLGRRISLAGAGVGLVLSILLLVEVLRHGVIAGQMGSWAAPFGITLVADILSAAMVVITAISGFAVAIYAAGEIDGKQERLGFHALYHLLLAGVTGAFLTGDIFNLYVWFEVMLIASFGLLILGGTKAQIDGAVKYVTLNLVATILFLAGVGLLYGATGTLNMAQLHGAVAASDQQGLMTVIAMFFMIAFGMKAAVFPLFFWLPASYHTPSFTVSAIFAGLLTKVGVYALMRVFTLIFTGDVGYTHDVLLWVSAATMVTGVLGAAAMMDFRKILSFHIISQIGYMTLGLAIYTPLAIAGAIFYLIHHIIVKMNLFLVSGVAHQIAGGTDLYRIGGLYKSSPALAIMFLIPAFSLAGFPPLSGFWAKLLIVQAALEAEAWVIAGISLAVGLLTIFSMAKIWSEAFWKPHPEGTDPTLASLGGKAALFVLPMAGLCLLTLAISVMPDPFIAASERAAGQLLDPQAYVAAVLGEPGAEMVEDAP